MDWIPLNKHTVSPNMVNISGRSSTNVVRVMVTSKTWWLSLTSFIIIFYWISYHVVFFMSATYKNTQVDLCISEGDFLTPPIFPFVKWPLNDNKSEILSWHRLEKIKYFVHTFQPHAAAMENLSAKSKMKLRLIFTVFIFHLAFIRVATELTETNKK